MRGLIKMKYSSEFKEICMNCKNRAVGCQCFCPDYSEFRKLLEEEKKRIQMEKAERDFYFSLKRGFINGKKSK